MSILQANEITIRIIDKIIIHGLSLSVPEGKVTSIIGPNGCGKSTTLKALARIWPCYKGNVTFNGEDTKQQRKKQCSRFGAWLGLKYGTVRYQRKTH